MELTYDVLKAFCNDVKWHDGLAIYLGPEWDYNGIQLLTLIWDKIYNIWGEYGADFVSEYIEGTRPYMIDSDGEKIYAVDINSLVAILNEFFLVKEEDKEED
ncbi:hypothetical protein IJD44_00880 [bacterium]|nr:hypothetical protein [bacterium]